MNLTHSMNAALILAILLQDEDNPSRTTLRSTIDSWLKDFFAMATVMVRCSEVLGLCNYVQHFSLRCGWIPMLATI